MKNPTKRIQFLWGFYVYYQGCFITSPNEWVRHNPLPSVRRLRGAHVSAIGGLAQRKLDERGDVTRDRNLTPTAARLKDGVTTAGLEEGKARAAGVDLSLLLLFLVRLPVVLALLQFYNTIPALDVRLSRRGPDPALDVAGEVAQRHSGQMGDWPQVESRSPAVSVLLNLRKEAAVERRLELIGLVLADLAAGVRVTTRLCHLCLDAPCFSASCC